MRITKRRKAISSKPDQIEYFTPAQSDEFLEAIRGDKFEALFTTSLTTGARPSELFGLQWSEVDLAKKRITLMRNTRKLCVCRCLYFQSMGRSG